MDIIETQINPTSAEFKANQAHHQALAQELRERLAQVRRGGSEKAQQRHREQGKLFVRERVDSLLDVGSPFLELSPLAAWGLYNDEAPGAGIVTGIGRVSGREVLIIANDATVKGGDLLPYDGQKTPACPGHCRRKPLALRLFSRFRRGLPALAR